MKCSILIITYNAIEYTKKCLDLLLKDDLDDDIEIILFDNKSSDGVDQFIKKFEERKNVKVILNEKNLGFALGNNTAANFATGEYLFLLNPDTEILLENVKNLIDYLDRNSNVGVVGPKIFDSNGLAQESFGYKMTIFSEIIGKIFGSVYLQNLPIIKYFRKKYYDRDVVTEVGWIGGAALMIRNSIFKKIGGIDKVFFYSAGDMVDLCAMVREMNYKVIFFPDVKMVHKGGASNVKDKNKALLSALDGSLYYFKKHYNYFMYILMKIFYIIISIVKGLIAGVFILTGRKKFFDISKSHFYAVFSMILGKI